jgi:hypothetical protein
VYDGGNIWTSNNSGANWTEDTSVGATKDWWGITSSADGTKLAIIKKLVDPFQRETMRNYNFYKKHQNYIDNFRIMANEKRDILNVDKYLKH